jgi:hypothetical protein
LETPSALRLHESCRAHSSSTFEQAFIPFALSAWLKIHLLFLSLRQAVRMDPPSRPKENTAEGESSDEFAL